MFTESRRQTGKCSRTRTHPIGEIHVMTMVMEPNNVRYDRRYRVDCRRDQSGTHRLREEDGLALLPQSWMVEHADNRTVFSESVLKLWLVVDDLGVCSGRILLLVLSQFGQAPSHLSGT